MLGARDQWKPRRRCNNSLFAPKSIPSTKQKNCFADPAMPRHASRACQLSDFGLQAYCRPQPCTEAYSTARSPLSDRYCSNELYSARPVPAESQSATARLSNSCPPHTQDLCHAERSDLLRCALPLTNRSQPLLQIGCTLSCGLHRNETFELEG